MQQQQATDVVAAAVDARWEQARNTSASRLPAIHGGGDGSGLPRLVAIARAPPTPPSPPTARKQDLSHLPSPRQRLQLPPPASGSASLLKFPSLVKPQHRPPALVSDKVACNQEEDESVRTNGAAPEDDDGGKRANRSASASRLLSSLAAGGGSRPVGDKNRDFIRELEEKKRKQREAEARKERRKHKLHEKLTRKILEEARQKQQQQAEPEENDCSDTTDSSGANQGDHLADGAQEAERDSDGEDARQRKEKARRQKRLLKKQQALLEQLQAKKKEREEEAELEREKERRKHEMVRKAALTAISDANARCQEEEEAASEYEPAAELCDDKKQPTSSSPHAPVGPTFTATVAAGSAIAVLRDRRDALAAAPQQHEEAPDELKQRTKEQRDALNRKQQEYLQKLAEQRKQKLKVEDDARALQEKRKRKLQQEALLRHQEVARQQQEAAAAAAQREKEESAERAANAPAAVDVDAMVARLSRLKERDAQVVPEARDFASWKKRHGVRADQSVFCVTGCYPVIRDELEKRGWFYNPEKLSPFFDLKWSLKSDDLKAVKLEKHQYVNHFFQNTAITTKVGLLHNLRSIVWHQSLDIDTIFPRAYDLNEPRDMEAFVQDFRYGFAEGLLKELAKICLERGMKKTATMVKANMGVVDVLLSVARKKVKSKRPDSDEGEPQSCDALEESIDSLVTPGHEDLVTDLEWEVLTKCQVDKPGSLRASLVYRKKVYAEDKSDSSLGVDGGSGASQPNSAPSVDTVLSALEKKQQRQLEKQRSEAFSREKARLAQRLAVVDTIDEATVAEVVRLVKTLEKLCPQFHINGGWDLSPADENQQQQHKRDATLSSKSLNIWIVKPAGMSRGRGIRVFNNLEQLLEYADVENHKECQWVAQKYIENPLLVCKRKFDIRQWVLVTSWDPLTVWFNQDCYLRFSSEEYSMEDLSDQYVHLTNNSIQKYSDKFHDVYATDDGDIAVEGNMLHSDDFKRYLVSKLGRPASFWDDELQRRMKDIVVGSLQCVQDMVQHRANCCELFGYDFMIDADLTPWLIEVNSSPACDYSTPTAERYVKEGLAGIVKVIVDHREYELKKRGGGSLSEPDTGRWQRIHRAEYIGKPVSSFGADFVVKGAKVARGRRGGGRVAASTGNSYSNSTARQSANAAATAPSEREDDDAGEGDGGFVIVESEESEEQEEQEERSTSGDSEESDASARPQAAAGDEDDEGDEGDNEDSSVDSLL